MRRKRVDGRGAKTTNPQHTEWTRDNRPMTGRKRGENACAEGICGVTLASSCEQVDRLQTPRFATSFWLPSVFLVMLGLWRGMTPIRLSIGIPSRGEQWANGSKI